MVLKTFYSVIKDADPHIEFLLITGVSKFSKGSIFSDLNNLDDITLGGAFAAITAIPKTYWKSSLQGTCRKLQNSLDFRIQNCSTSFAGSTMAIRGIASPMFTTHFRS